MFNLKKGTSVISLVLCAVVIALVTTALVVATNNSAVFRAQMLEKEQLQKVETHAYTKVYVINEVRNIARQAYVNNYITFYNNEVNLQEFEQLIIQEMVQQIPQNQMENYVIQVTPDGVYVQYK